MMKKLSYICIDNGIKSNNKMNSKIIWNTACIAGLALGAVSTVCMFVGQYLSTQQLSAGANSFLGLILWLVETVGCIWLMGFFMKKMVRENNDVTNSQTFRMGLATALLSGLLFAAANFANIAFISADYYTKTIDAILQQMSSTMDSNSLAAADAVLNYLPQISFFGTLIQCVIFGTIVAAILSRSIPSKDPFANFKVDEQ